MANIDDAPTREALDSQRRMIRKLDARVNRVFSAGDDTLTTQLTTVTHTAPTTADYALQDLIDSSAGATFGFATKDEGNTLLSVVVNLQARVQELEDKISAMGLLT